MPSAHVHGAIFCRKELREKVGVKVRFVLGLSQRTRLIFCGKQLREKIGPIFFSDQKSAHTDRLFIGAIVQARSHCWMTSLRFFIGLKSAHTDRFFVVSSSEKISERFYIKAKVSAHEPIFTPVFCLRLKIGPRALGIRLQRVHC